MLEGVMADPERAVTGEVQVGPKSNRRTFLVRIGAEQTAGRTDGYVVTFDDITELQSAQRKAAWADVARRIAHEIKNPLTPIQLGGGAAEAAVSRGKLPPTRRLSRSAPTRLSGMWAISGGWWTSFPRLQGCRCR